MKTPRKLSLLQEKIFILVFSLKWLSIALIIGGLAGSMSAFFLWSLKQAELIRNDNLWLICLLPIAGLIIGLSYHYLGRKVVKGNNQIIDEVLVPQNIISLRMTPLVLFGTIVTHLFGGSAGREGTAIQMSSSVADQFTRIFKLKPRDRRILLIMGMSAGFASVFGTPLAGAVFAIEVLVIGRMRYEAILPSFMSAAIANVVCHMWNVGHTHYHIGEIPHMSIWLVAMCIAAGIFFGFAGALFSKACHFWANLFKKYISYSPLRPFVGGVILAIAVYLIGTTKYIGLGVPTIVESFSIQMQPWDFALKILFTSFTLGAGFKGGEVTPLFFTGATLGSALSLFFPMPVGMLAGMGFVAVFSGATNTPIACTLMGIELFGVEAGIYIGIACVTAYLFSGHSGIYTSQKIGSPKHLFYGREKGLRLTEVKKYRHE
ncbi:MAG: voltage-gated chloride channel family protein [Marinifilaceae bacterium]|jgi:H+/Cl- antiporter ClcA|nr:voltage-gated chloride channel family protein [Marinifilaceae bacterium]